MMGFPNVDIAQIQRHLDDGFENLGHTANVTLRSGETFDIKATVGFRREVGLTEGLAQNTERLKFRCSEWDAASPGRAPQKGDQIVVQGRRHAIQAAIRQRGIGDVPLLYVCEISG